MYHCSCFTGIKKDIVIVRCARAGVVGPAACNSGSAFPPYTPSSDQADGLQCYTVVNIGYWIHRHVLFAQMRCNAEV